MNKDGKNYEPPMAKIYQFDDNDQILTASGESITEAASDYAARALNGLMGGTNTTLEK